MYLKLPKTLITLDAIIKIFYLNNSKNFNSGFKAWSFNGGNKEIYFLTRFFLCNKNNSDIMPLK